MRFTNCCAWTLNAHAIFFGIKQASEPQRTRPTRKLYRSPIRQRREEMGQIGELFKRVGGHFLLAWLIIGIIHIWSVPIHAATVTITMDCQNGAPTVDVDREPGACPPALLWQPGSPPPGAIQVNPTSGLPANAKCGTDMAHNKCSQQGFACQPGMKCKDTWNSVTKACMCKCLP